MFGIVQKKNNIIHLLPNREEGIIEILQDFFKKHVVYKNIQTITSDTFDYALFSNVFNSVYLDTNISKKTKLTYCSKLYNWLLRLGLIVDQHGTAKIITTPSFKNVSESMERVARRGRFNVGNQNLFWGQSSPEKVIETFGLLKAGTDSYAWLKAHGYRNAIEILVAARALHKEKDRVFLCADLSTVFSNISNSETILFAKDTIQTNPNVRSVEMGQTLSEKFSRNWTKASKVRYGNAIMRWVKYLETVDLFI